MIAITLERPAGTALCPQVLSPQATTVPSACSARLLDAPAPSSTTFVRPVGMEDCPSVLSPQATTVPSPSSPRLWWLPAPIATTLVTVAGGAGTTPQETTLPLFLRAMRSEEHTSELQSLRH